MTTRSKKRRNSLHENTDIVERKLVVMSERKRSSSRFKENKKDCAVDLFKSKKRNNYVSYPTDDENLGDNTDDSDSRNLRISRRNALKEQNIETPITEMTETLITQRRVTRRTNKINENEENDENSKQETISFNKTKKVKKNKKIIVEENNVLIDPVEVAKNKPKKKKGKNSNSLISEPSVHDEGIHTDNLNSGNLSKNSTDSFYSASGSPQHGRVNKNQIKPKITEDAHSKFNMTNEVKTKSPGKGIKNEHSKITITTYNSKDSLSESTDSFVFLKGTEISNDLMVDEPNFENSASDEQVSTKKTLSLLKKRKTPIKNTTYEKENDDKTSPKVKFNKNSLINSTLIDKNDTTKINTTFEMEKKSSLIENRKSVINTTYEKDKKESPQSSSPNTNISLKLNSTFNMNDISPAINNTFETENIFHTSNSPNNKRKSTVINTTYEKDVNSPKTQELNDLQNFQENISDTRESFGNDTKLNTTFELEDVKAIHTNKSKMNTTFEKNNTSLISSDGSNSEDICHISLTSDDSSIDLDNKTTNSSLSSENKGSNSNEVVNKDTSKVIIMNTTPFFIESSIDETLPDVDVTPKKETFTPLRKSAATPLKLPAVTTLKEKPSATPLKEKPSATPLKEKPSATPLKEKPTAKPLKEKPSATPLKEKPPATPLKEKPPATPLKEKPSATPLKEKPSATPLKEKPPATPLKKKPSATLLKENTAITPKKPFVTPVKKPILIPFKKSAVTPAKDVGVTPLKREGTFTKNDDEIVNKSDDIPKVTPTKSISLATPGHTPFPTRTSYKDKHALNVTRSIEKNNLFVGEEGNVVPRMTRVMFCSPVNDSTVVFQQKKKVIKSSLKGSNKSFVFEENESITKAIPRKRSYTQNDAEEASAKRQRLANDDHHTHGRLSRNRTSSASAKLTELTSSSKKEGTPSKVKLSRTKLPNFAALHKKNFNKMESLDECQERKARRAKQLLTPKKSIDKNCFEDLKVEIDKDTKEAAKKLESTSKPLTVDENKPNYTRFGFKLNLDVNPFSILSKKVVESQPKGLDRQTMPSTSGMISLRRETAKQVVMREKSFTDKRSVKRNETRNYIKGVRTNRRFDLQMKLRNME